MPLVQAEVLTAAFHEFRQALDPHDPWANSRLATVVKAADAAGWSRRTTATALGLSRERTRKIAAFPAAAKHKMPRYELGIPFPSSAITAFRKHQDEVNLRRIRTEMTLVATIRAAHDAGWPYNTLGALVGASGERLRQIAEIDIDVSDEPTPVFDAFTRILKQSSHGRAARRLDESEVQKLGKLADRARKATKSVGKRLGSNPNPDQLLALEASLEDRLASEELSALIISLKSDNVSWPDLDAACGYKPGGARARALRHGYAKTPPSMSPYTPTPLPGWPARETISQLTGRASV